MAASLVQEHNGSRPVLLRLAAHMAKQCAVQVLAVEKRSHSAVLERRGWVQMEKHSTEAAMSHEIVQQQNRRLLGVLVLVMVVLFFAAMSLMIFR